MANSLLCEIISTINIGDITMTEKNKDLNNKIGVCFVAYRPTVTENDVDDLVQFIVIVAQEGFKTVKVA